MLFPIGKRISNVLLLLSCNVESLARVLLAP